MLPRTTTNDDEARLLVGPMTNIEFKFALMWCWNGSRCPACTFGQRWGNVGALQHMLAHLAPKTKRLVLVLVGDQEGGRAGVADGAVQVPESALEGADALRSHWRPIYERGLTNE